MQPGFLSVECPDAMRAGGERKDCSSRIFQFGLLYAILLRALAVQVTIYVEGDTQPQCSTFRNGSFKNLKIQLC